MTPTDQGQQAPTLLGWAGEAKFTPGPWVTIRCGGRDDSAVATIEPKPETMTGPNYWTVASVNTLREAWKANAHLIAAAPELFDELLLILQSIEGGGDMVTFNEVVVARYRALIAKAQGGTQ